MRRVKIVRSRPSGGRIVIAFLITALIVFLLTLSFQREEEKKDEQEKRIVREITLSGGEGFIVHFGAFESETDAMIACARYMNRGAAGYLFPYGGKYYAAGNLYDNEAEADENAKRLQRNGIHAETFRISGREVILKLTGTEEKIDALGAVYEMYLQAERELMKLSGKLDSGETSLSKANVALSVLRYDARLAMKKTACLSKENKTVREMLDLFEKGFSNLETLHENAGGEMILSARVKHALIGMRVTRYEFLNGL